jgi:hypothetical protein
MSRCDERLKPTRDIHSAMDKRTMAAPLTPKPTRKGVVVGHPFHVLQIAKGICSLFSGCVKKLKLLEKHCRTLVGVDARSSFVEEEERKKRNASN